MDNKVNYNGKEYDIEKMTIEERNKIIEEVRKNRMKLEEDLKELLKTK